MRTTMAGSTLSLMLAGGLLVGTPMDTAEAARFKDWGTAKSRNYVIKPGCHRYLYRYNIKPPRPYDSAAAEIFLVGPRGRGLASAAKLTSYNPAKGRARFKLCANSITPGRHVLKMKVTFKRGFNTREGFVRPTTFRFRRRR